MCAKKCKNKQKPPIDNSGSFRDGTDTVIEDRGMTTTEVAALIVNERDTSLMDHLTKDGKYAGTI